ncbi:hypothetical protein AAG570_005227 [Ranatra chinensis]|uniref:Uncharacterized protein n=1 Tax=Ranatra chinensis TaxID=642074 RepID=A0ABD0Y2B4_9HEMI
MDGLVAIHNSDNHNFGARYISTYPTVFLQAVRRQRHPNPPSTSFNVPAQGREKLEVEDDRKEKEEREDRRTETEELGVGKLTRWQEAAEQAPTAANKPTTPGQVSQHQILKPISSQLLTDFLGSIS